MRPPVTAPVGPPVIAPEMLQILLFELLFASRLHPCDKQNH
ncbi:hypothetical protein [Bartonella koehlerae]|nr:hypothetical protein [Bartonella koehlerae]